MSDTVNKISIPPRQTDYRHYHQKTASTTSAKANVSTLPDDVDVTSYSALLDEAYDGDMSEYIAIGQSNRRAASVSDGYRPAIAEELGKQSEEGNRFKQKDHLEKLRQSNQTQRIESSNDAASEHHARVSIKNAHDHFMLMSSQINCTEAGSRASLKAFSTVVTVLNKASWERSDYLEKHLVQNQMAAIL